MCMMLCRCFCFFLTVAATSEVYTLSLRDALPICSDGDNFFRAKAVDGSARDQAKWRVTVVKHAHDRRNTEGTYTKGISELWHHHTRSGAQRVLIKIINSHEQPGAERRDRNP